MPTAASARSRGGGRVRETRAIASLPTIYLESSALVAVLLESERHLLVQLRSGNVAASALTFAEARRAIIRAVTTGRIDGDEEREAQRMLREVEAGCRIFPVTDDILARAGRRFPVEPVRTLDAIHLASAELLDSPEGPVTLLTRDDRIRENALRLGMQVA